MALGADADMALDLGADITLAAFTAAGAPLAMPGRI
jgi:hypothetical protein